MHSVLMLMPLKSVGKKMESSHVNSPRRKSKNSLNHQVFAFGAKRGDLKQTKKGFLSSNLPDFKVYEFYMFCILYSLIASCFEILSGF